MNHPNNRIPEEVRLQHGRGALTLVYGTEQKSPGVEFLHAFSPSAGVRGHAPGQGVLQMGEAGVTIMGLEPVRQHALKITFSDGHDNDLYGWVYLHKLAHNYDAFWVDYLRRMELTGASRIPSPGDLKVEPKSGHVCGNGDYGGRY